MISKKISFKDMNGEEREITAYFNLSEADQAELSLIRKGGLKAYMEQCLDLDDDLGVVKFFRTMIEKSFGKKVRDPEYGLIFMKDPIETAKFMNSNAYTELFKELMSNEKVAIEFIKGLPEAPISDEEFEKAKDQVAIENSNV